MYKTLIWCTSAIVCLAALIITAVAASASQLTVINKVPLAPIAIVTPTEPELPITAPVNEEKVKFDKFSGYVLDAMNSATTPDKYSASYEDIANDITTVVLDSKEPSIWKSDTTKARTAIILVSLAFHESRFRAYVDDGRCNDANWRKSSEGIKLMGNGGACDGGNARSMWQVHTSAGGIIVVPANYGDSGPFGSNDVNKREWCYSYQCSEDDGTLVTPSQIVTERQSAVRVALHMARRSIRSGSKLCQFSGESDGCPKGDTRYSWAERYSKKHPFE